MSAECWPSFVLLRVLSGWIGAYTSIQTRSARVMKLYPKLIRTLRWSISIISIGATALYAAYVTVFWVSAWVGYGKGDATGLTTKFIIGLYVLPSFGIFILNLGSKLYPPLFNAKMRSWVSKVGSAAIMAAAVLACTPLTRIGR